MPKERAFARTRDVTSSSASPLEYERLRDALAAAGAVVALPELHGGVCGALCVGGAQAARRWLADCLDDEPLDPKSAVADELDEMIVTSEKMLDERELRFAPLLPGDDAPLEEQVEALASWCHGFLNGVGSTTAPAGRAAPEGTTLGEILHDFAELSRAGLSEDEAAGRDQPDFALAELHEYVRASVQIVFEELAGGRPATPRDVH